jgi:hypothetical protein
MKIIDNISTLSSVIILTDSPLTDVVRADVIVNGVAISNIISTSTIYYQITGTNEVRGAAAIKVYNLSTTTCYNFTATVYGDPSLEFWKYDFNAAALNTTTAYNSKIWNDLSYSPSDITVNGDQFLSPYAGYAPEELVAGHTMDSLGINVYTNGRDLVTPLILTNSFPVSTTTSTVVPLSILPNPNGGLIVYYKGSTFNRITTSSFTASNQFFIDGNNLIIPAQSSKGNAGYTVVKIGGVGFTDGNRVTTTATNQTIAHAESLLSINDVQMAYVLVDGIAVNKITTTTNYGYMLESVGPNNHRACARIYNLPSGIHTIEAWFFNLVYDRVDNINEQTFSIGNTPQSTFPLSYPSDFLPPLNNKIMVQVVSTPASVLVPTIDYSVSGNILTLVTPISNKTIKVTTLNNQMLMQAEAFSPALSKRYTLSQTVADDNLVWVYLNGVLLVSRHDYEILEDLRTIELGEWIDVMSTDKIVIAFFQLASSKSSVLGYRVFKDFFDRLQYKRLAKSYSTVLSRPLRYDDSEIYVEDGGALVPPNPQVNIPGVVIIDGERIEFSRKDGNILGQLRRATLGTGPVPVSQIGTAVIDQNLQQTVPYNESMLVQTFTSTNTTSYVINTITTADNGDGITLTAGITATDQVMVYYGGRLLRKDSIIIQDMSMSYDPTDESLITVDPEFSITTSTQKLELNIEDGIVPGVEIAVIQRKGYIWSGTESLLTSPVIQAKFLRDREAALPDRYYYGGGKTSFYIGMQG